MTPFRTLYSVLTGDYGSHGVFGTHEGLGSPGFI